MAGRDEMLRRQRALADFGDFVLDHEDLDEVLNEGCRLIAAALDCDLAKVIVIERETNTGLVRAGVGWRPGIVGHERISLSERSSEAYAIASTEPVITNDIAREERFEFPSFLREHDVVALVNVPILLPGRRPWGILQVDARRRRDFAQEDIEFLKTYAMVLGPVIDRVQVAHDREQARQGLAEREERLRRMLDGMGEGFTLLAPDFTILEQNRQALLLDGRPRAEIVGRSQWEVYPGSEQAEVGRLLKQAMAERTPVTLEHRYAWEDGHVRWLEMHACPTTDGCLAVFWRDVTENRQAAEALKESEARYRALFESMDEAYAVVEVLKDGDGQWADFRFLEVNRAFLEHTSMPWPVGKTAKELLGSPNARWVELYGEALDTGQSIRVQEDEPVLGRTFDLNIFSLDREQNRVAVLFTNVTERNQAEAALRESESRLTAAFESVPAGVGAIDAAGNVILANAEYRRFLATGVIPSRDPKGAQRWQAWDEHGRLLPREEFPGARALRGESVVPGQEMLVTDDAGREIWTNVATAPTFDSEGRVTGCVSVISDITQRRRNAEALRESEERLRQFGEASQDVLWIRDAGTLQWTYLTAAFERIYGLDREEALAGDSYGNWLNLIVREDRAKAEDAIAQVRRGESVTFEYRIVRPSDGQLRWLRDTDFPIRDAAGQVTLIGGIGHDITERRQSDERQKLLLAELQHRVRNILAMVRSVARRTVQAAESVEDLGNHLDGRLASLARTQAMLTRAAAVGVDLETLIREELLAQHAEEAAFTLRGPTVELAPKAAEVLTLAIHELATNATKYGAFAQPGGALEVRWSIEADEGGPDRLRLLWQEAGVALAAVAPRRVGFGSELIQRRVPYELKGAGALEMRPGGIRAEVTFPLVPGESVLATDPPRGLPGSRADP